MARSLADTVGFEILDDGLAQDVKDSVRIALARGAVFLTKRPLAVFRAALRESIREIESDPRGQLLQRFLRDGPYDGEGAIPPSVANKFLSDDDTAKAITFVYAHMVNCFKGQLAELLAAAPCLLLVEQLRAQRRLAQDARLYVGDVVRLPRAKGAGFAKGADLHVAVVSGSGTAPMLSVVGVGEVKSYSRVRRPLWDQLDRHVRRLRGGARVGDLDMAPERIVLGQGREESVVRIAVAPARWTMPRSFHFETTEKGRSLHVDPATPPSPKDRIEQIGTNQWLITLRWSQEALAAAAYEMTFWYMEKVGEVLRAAGVPPNWAAETKPAAVGRNAAEMALYYSIRRCESALEEQRAVALYNSYGFGYALGMSFRDRKGRRAMLWPEDLDEIAANGQTKNGCRITR